MKSISLHSIIFVLLYSKLSSSCPKGWLRFYGSKCVAPAIEPMAHQDALMDCKQKHGKMFLPESNAENECAKILFTLMPYATSYMRMDGRGGTKMIWHTEAGVKLDPLKSYDPYTNWVNSQKTKPADPEMCLVMPASGEWEWDWCTQRSNAFHVCEFKKEAKSADNVTHEVLRILTNMKNDKVAQMSDEGMLADDDEVKQLQGTDHYKLKYQSRIGLRKMKIYRVIQNPGTFEGANAACKLLGSKLVQIESSHENDFLRRNLNRGYHWISAVKPIPEATNFVTSDGKELPYQPDQLDSSEDTGDVKTCIAINSGLWVEMNCMERANVICETEPDLGVAAYQEYDSLIEQIGNVPKKVTLVNRRLELSQELILQLMKDQQETLDELNTNICHLK